MRSVWVTPEALKFWCEWNAEKSADAEMIDLNLGRFWGGLSQLKWDCRLEDLSRQFLPPQQHWALLYAASDLAEIQAQEIKPDDQLSVNTQKINQPTNQRGCHGKDGGNLPILAVAMSQQNSKAGGDATSCGNCLPSIPLSGWVKQTFNFLNNRKRAMWCKGLISMNLVSLLLNTKPYMNNGDCLREQPRLTLHTVL